MTDTNDLIEPGTPLPWEWRNDQLLPYTEQWTISPGVLIADCNNGTPGGDEIDCANARYIVEACNAYPKLQSELSTLRQQAEAMAKALKRIMDASGDDEGKCEPCWAVFAIAKDALQSYRSQNND